MVKLVNIRAENIGSEATSIIKLVTVYVLSTLIDDKLNLSCPRMNFFSNFCRKIRADALIDDK